ncbi:hypothetical protein [Kribbella sp. NPDC055071]
MDDRQKARILVRETWAAWSAYSEAVATRRRVNPQAAYRARRLASLTGRAGSALFRLACDDLDDLGPRIAYGEMAQINISVFATSGRTVGGYAIQEARHELWALHGLDLALGIGAVHALLHTDPIAVEFSSTGETGEADGEDRVAAAARARLDVAARLQQRPGKRPKDPMTPEQLDATLRARVKFFSTDQLLLAGCQLRTCQGLDPLEEAETLVVEARAIYRHLLDHGVRFTADDLTHAETRCNKILAGL